MRTSIRRFLALFSFLTLCANVRPIPVMADGVGCPPCDRNEALPATPGSNLNVCIDGSWDTSPGSGQTVNDIWNATQGAVNSWNTARGSNGAASPYSFSLNQNAACDVKIFSELPAGVQDPLFTASITDARTAQGYFKLYLPGQTWNNAASVDDLKGLVAHELGHPLGLGNSKDGVRVGTCSSELAGSIMDSSTINPTYPTGSLKSPTKNVQARDVDAARRKAFNNSTCSTIPEDEGTGSPVLDACSLNPCSYLTCPDFDLEECTNFRIFRREDMSDGNQCYERYEITDHYWCDGGGCSYLGSSWRFLNVWCVASP